MENKNKIAHLITNEREIKFIMDPPHEHKGLGVIIIIIILWLPHCGLAVAGLWCTPLNKSNDFFFSQQVSMLSIHS